jgi:hypothetical protein
MHTKIVGLFLPVVFIVHNIEEYRSFEKFKTFYLKAINSKFRHRTVFLYALMILTIFVSGVCISNYLMTSQILRFATTIVAMSLLANGIQHCISSLWARKILPGTISAIFLLIPCSAIYLVFLEKETQFSILDIVGWFIVSMIVMFLSIRASLWIGYFLFKRSNSCSKK